VFAQARFPLLIGLALGRKSRPPRERREGNKRRDLAFYLIRRGKRVKRRIISKFILSRDLQYHTDSFHTSCVDPHNEYRYIKHLPQGTIPQPCQLPVLGAPMENFRKLF